LSFWLLARVDFEPSPAWAKSPNKWNEDAMTKS
jgi:hypothetical protein